MGTPPAAVCDHRKQKGTAESLRPLTSTRNLSAQLAHRSPLMITCPRLVGNRRSQTEPGMRGAGVRLHFMRRPTPPLSPFRRAIRAGINDDSLEAEKEAKARARFPSRHWRRPLLRDARRAMGEF